MNRLLDYTSWYLKKIIYFFLRNNFRCTEKFGKKNGTAPPNVSILYTHNIITKIMKSNVDTKLLTNLQTLLEFYHFCADVPFPSFLNSGSPIAFGCPASSVSSGPSRYSAFRCFSCPRHVWRTLLDYQYSVLNQK